MKRTCWDTRATDSIIKSGQKDTEVSITVRHFDDIHVPEKCAVARLAIKLKEKFFFQRDIFLILL